MIKKSSFSAVMKGPPAALGAAALIGLSVATTGFAADAPASSDNRLDEVVVTASKREERAFEVANSVTALAGDSLALLPDFRNFAPLVPGLQVQQTSAGRNRLILRGLNSGGSGAVVGTVIDEMPLSFSSGNVDGANITTNPITYDMQRVEVLRGPQGTIYGAAAEGGLIKYVTNKPVLGTFEAGFEVGGVSVSDGETAGNIKGFVNIPLGDKFAIRATGFAERLPGFIDNFVTGEKDINGGDRNGGRIGALWRPTDNLTITAQASKQSLEVGGRNAVALVGAQREIVAGQPVPANAQDLAKGLGIDLRLSEYEDFPMTSAYLQLDYDAPFAKITSVTSRGTITGNNRVDFSGRQIRPGIPQSAFFGPGGPAPIYRVPIVSDARNELKLTKKTQELRIASLPDSKIGSLGLQWQVGGMITDEFTAWTQYAGFYAASDPDGPELAPAGGSAQLDAPYKEKAYFADLTLGFTPKFDINVGGRYSNTEQKSQINLRCCVIFGPGGSLQALRIEENTTTWSFAPRYRVSEDTLVYARVATGFRPGGPQLIPPGPIPPDFPFSYKSDHTVNSEIGFRTYLMDRAVSIDVAAYSIKWTDIQVVTVFRTSAGLFNLKGNASDAKSEGVEWNLSWKAAPGLTLGAVGNFTNARLTSSNAAYGGNSGDRLAFVPKFVSTLTFDYNRPAFGAYEGFIGGMWTYNGDVQNDFVAATAVSTAGPRTTLPSYNTFSLNAGLRNDRFTYEIYGQNLSNSRALLGYSAQGTALGYGSGTILQPRTIGVRIAYRP